MMHFVMEEEEGWRKGAEAVRKVVENQDMTTTVEVAAGIDYNLVTIPQYQQYHCPPPLPEIETDVGTLGGRCCCHGHHRDYYYAVAIVTTFA